MCVCIIKIVEFFFQKKQLEPFNDFFLRNKQRYTFQSLAFDHTNHCRTYGSIVKFETNFCHYRN